MKKSPLLWGVPLLTLTFLLLTTGCAPKAGSSNETSETMVEDRTFHPSFQCVITPDPAIESAVAKCTLNLDLNRPQNAFLANTDSITVDFELENIVQPWVFDSSANCEFSQLSNHCGDELSEVFSLDGHQMTLPSGSIQNLNGHLRLKPKTPLCESNHVQFSGGLIVVVIESLPNPSISLKSCTVKAWYQGNSTTVPQQN